MKTLGDNDRKSQNRLLEIAKKIGLNRREYKCARCVCLCLTIAGLTFAQSPRKSTPVKSPAPLVLSPIAIDPVHENDEKITGYCPILNAPIIAKINGKPAVSPTLAGENGR